MRFIDSITPQSSGWRTEVTFEGKNAQQIFPSFANNFLDVQSSYPTEEERFLNDQDFAGVA